MQRSTSSFLMALALASVATAAPVTVIDENFEDDTNGAMPGNSGSIGTWVPNQWQSTPYYDPNNANPDTFWQLEVHQGGVGGGKAIYEDNIHRGFWSPGATSGPLQEFTKDGFIQATVPANTPGDVVHGRLSIKYRDGIIVFGLTSSVANMAALSNRSTPLNTAPDPTFIRTAANPDATLVLGYGDGYEGGEKLDAWVGGVRRRLDPDPAAPYSYHTYEFQYTVGSPTLDYLMLNGSPVTIQAGEPGAGGLVPVNVPGGVDGFFFSDSKVGTDYSVDDIFLEVTRIPEPAGAAMLALGTILGAARRRR